MVVKVKVTFSYTLFTEVVVIFTAIFAISAIVIVVKVRETISQ